MKTPFKMKGFSGFGNSPLNKKTDKVPTTGPTDGVTAGDIETSKEEAERSLGQRGNVVDILKRRKRKKKKTKKTVDLMKTAATTDKPAKYYKLVDGKKVQISEATYDSLLPRPK